MARGRRFTIYDAMENKGVFEANTANVHARDSEGRDIYVREEFPRMVYHPEGKRKVIVPAEAVMTPFGPKLLGEQTEIIWKLVESPKALVEAKAAGWHLHPADAMEAAGEDAPSRGMASDVRSAQDEISRLQAENAELRAMQAGGYSAGSAPASSVNPLLPSATSDLA